jgi:hypothetical protein
VTEAHRSVGAGFISQNSPGKNGFIGKKTDPIPFTYDQDKVILYACGRGIGVEKFDFFYEKNFEVYPTRLREILMVL